MAAYRFGQPGCLADHFEGRTDARDPVIERE
jgi:hypothetical protein